MQQVQWSVGDRGWTWAGEAEVVDVPVESMVWDQDQDDTACLLTANDQTLGLLLQQGVVGVGRKAGLGQVSGQETTSDSLEGVGKYPLKLLQANAQGLQRFLGCRCRCR